MESESLVGLYDRQIEGTLFWKRNQIAGKTKDELIALLVEKMSRESTKVEFSDSLMKMILQMQEQQLQMQKETRT